MRWFERFFGWEYDRVTANCGHFAEKVELEIFGRHCNFHVPAEFDPRLADAVEQQAAALQQVTRRHEAKDGDLVIMTTGGQPTHIGVYYRNQGVEHVLHAMNRDVSVCNTRLSVLPRIGYGIHSIVRPQ